MIRFPSLFLVGGATSRSVNSGSRLSRAGLALLLASGGIWAVACRDTVNQIPGVRPRSLRDVPAERLAFRFQADTGDPSGGAANETGDKLPSIQADFDTRRKNEALLRTVLSPDGQRALALYGTDSTPEGEFLMDLYSADGKFLRNIFPKELSGTFPAAVTWSPDGQFIAFTGRAAASAQSNAPEPPDVPGQAPMASPETSLGPSEPPAALPSVAPAIAPVAVFNTEQIYLCDRDGYNMRPLTTRYGLIYFNLGWASDSRGLSALACKEDEWDQRASRNMSPAGRPRILTVDGTERLLDDRVTDVLPVWSPDLSKVATAFDTDLVIYDVTDKGPTAAGIPLKDPLLTASASYDARSVARKSASAPGSNGKARANSPSASTPTAAASESPGSGTPISFNPIISLEWPQPETILVETGFVRIYGNHESVANYLRWHTVHLSAQAVLLKD